MSAKQVLVLAAHDQHAAASRFRLAQFFPALEARGIQATFLPFANQTLTESLQGFSASPRRRVSAVSARLASWLRALIRERHVDAVWIQREAAMLGPPVVELLFAQRIPVVYDLDDAVWLSPPRTPGTPRARLGPLADVFRWPWKAQAILPFATAAIAGSDYLADYARQHCENVLVAPTTVDGQSWRPRDASHRAGPLVIGWIGTPSTASFLPLLFPALQKLRDDGIDFVFRTRGAPPGFNIPGVPTECLPWRLDHEAADFAALDIGVAPMPDTPWTRGKCGFKQIQFMATGVPFVSSAVGPALEIVSPALDGMLATTPQDWYQHLRLLATNAEARRERARNGRRAFDRRFSAEAVGASVVDLIAEVIESGQPSRSAARRKD